MLVVDLQPFRKNISYRRTSRDGQKHNHKLFLNNQAYCRDWFSVTGEVRAVDKNTPLFSYFKGSQNHRAREGDDL